MDLAGESSCGYTACEQCPDAIPDVRASLGPPGFMYDVCLTNQERL